MSNLLTKGAAVVGKLLAKGIITAPDITTTSVSFTVGTEATDVINVALVFKDGAGVTQAVPKVAMWYLATNSSGLTPATSVPTGGIVAGTNGKATKWTTSLSGFLVTTAAGLMDFNITDSGTPTFYLVVVLPNGSLAVSGAITFA